MSVRTSLPRRRGMILKIVVLLVALGVFAPAVRADDGDTEVSPNYHPISALVAAAVVTQPTIGSVSPTSGPMAGGTTVTLKGTNFTGATGVTFGGKAAAIATQTVAIASGGSGVQGSFAADTDYSGGTAYAVSSNINTTQVASFNVPTGVFDRMRYGDFVYTIPNLTAGASYAVVLFFCETYHTGAGQRQFDVTINGTQVLTNFDIFATAGGQNVATYQQFAATANGSGQIVISFINGPADTASVSGLLVTAVTSTTITLTTPSGSGAGAVNVAVTTPSGSVSASNVFTYVAPTITSVSSPSGPVTGGTAVTLTGTLLSGASSVTIGGQSATLASQTVVAIASGGSGAQGSFSADTYYSGGTAYAVSSTINTTQVASFNVPAAVFDRIRYGNFSYTIPNLTVGASYGVVLFFSEPYWNAPGERQFNVTINGTQVLTNFDIIAAAGGQNIATYKQFTATANSSGQIVITFVDGPEDTASISGLLITSTSISVTTPAITTGGGVVSVVATTTAGTASSSFTYLPVVSSVSPSSAALSPTSAVTISGNGFTGTTSVQFGTTSVTPTSVSETSITVVPPAASTAGAVAVSVTAKGTTASAPATSTTNGSFTYLPPPTITSVSPASGQVGGGTAVTLTGTSFAGATSVTFGGKAATIASQVVAIASGGSGAQGSFAADNYYSGGTAYAVSSTINTTQVASFNVPAAVFDRIRFGDFTYTIPNLTPGASYAVVLFFSEPYWNGAGQRLFDVTINGAQVLTNFDIFATAGGQNIGIYKQFAATANGSGQIVISFVDGPADTASLSGLLVSAVTPTTISLTTPSGSGPGAVNVVVTAPSGTVTAPNAFTYAAPTITSVSPASGPVTGGTTVTLTGTLLSGASSVTIGGQSATVASQTVAIASGGSGAQGSFAADTYFSGGSTYAVGSTINTTQVSSFNVPAAVFDRIRYGNFSYTIPNLTAGASYSVVLFFSEPYWNAPGERQFNVTINGTQVLTNFDIIAAAGGQNIATYKQFAATANGSGQIVITFIDGPEDTASVSGLLITAATSTTLSVTTPAITTGGGVVSVVVNTPAGTATSSYTYLPVVSSVTPNSGSVVPAAVTISGNGFTGTKSVQFGSVSATPTAITETSITVVPPGESVGMVAVSVTAQGSSASAPATSTTNGSFTYMAPTISSASPNPVGAGAAGTQVTINGKYFTGINTNALSSVTFGGVNAASITFVSDTQIIATPTFPGSSSGIAVTVGSATVSYSGWNFAAPSITSVSPNTVDIGGGTPVTITGQYFTGINTNALSSVTFAGVNAQSITFVSDSQLRAVTSPGTAMIGSATVTVGSLTGTYSPFTYGGDKITSISPSSGPITGGTSVNITGIGFTGATAVSFGTVPATSFTIHSDTSITAVSPASAAGAVNIIVTGNSVASTFTTSDQFTYQLYFNYSWTTWSSLNWSTPAGASINWNSQMIPVAVSVNNGFYAWYTPATQVVVNPANGSLSGVAWSSTATPVNIAGSNPTSGMTGPFAGVDPAGNGGSILAGDWKDLATGQLSYYGAYANGTAWNNPVFWSYYNAAFSSNPTYSVTATTTTITNNSGAQYYLIADGVANSPLGRTSYIGNSGMYYFNKDSSNPGNAAYSNGPLYQDSRVGLTEITDGSSNTLLFGESLGGPDNALPTYQLTWMGSGTIPSYWDCQTPSQYFMFSSMHPGVVNFAFCDGSVRSVSKVTASVPPDAMGTLSTANPGDGTNVNNDNAMPPAASNPATPRWIAFQRLAGINDNNSPDFVVLGLTP